MNNRRRFVLTLSLCTLCALAMAAAQSALKRPMQIHKVEELALEIWTEAQPEWDARVEWKNGQPIFVAETPSLTYPPAGMSWVSMAHLRFDQQALEEVARGAIHEAARNYKVRPDVIALKAAHYGDLAGYEAQFSADAQGTPVDVRVFCGLKPGKPAVVMQAFTLRGKLAHIGEQIRRSWTNVRYLD
jgi:hypothetical protein